MIVVDGCTQRFAAIFALIAAGLIGVTDVRAQLIVDGFNPLITQGAVHDVAVDGNGQILVGGEFILNNTRRIMRLHTGGSDDQTFWPGVSATSGVVRSILHVGTGYLAGGTFTGGSSPSYLARLNANGENVVGFGVIVNGAVNKAVRRFTGSGYLIGGAFNTVSGSTRNRIARLTSSFTLDAGFNPPAFYGDVYDVVERADGKVYVAGAFLGITGNAAAGYAVFRLNSNGSVDNTFVFDAVVQGIQHVFSIAFAPDGKLLIAGNFTAAAGSGQRQRIARLNTDGSVDLTFQGPTLNGDVLDMAVQPDGRIVIGGQFTGVGLSNRIARLHADGSVDASLSPFFDPNGTVRSVAVQADGGVLFAGDFTAIGGTQPASRVARIPLTGGLDSAFELSGTINGDINALAVEADGDVLAGGEFTNIGGTSRTYLARFSRINGILSPGVAPILNGVVHAIVIQPNGKFLVAGAFTVVNGTARRRIARFNADGSVDASFNGPTISDDIRAIELDPLGRIYIGGSFQTVGGQTRPHLARLLANGSVDVDFVDHGVDGVVRTISMAGDNFRIYIGGDFDIVGGYNQRSLARLWPHGELDTDFRGQTTEGSARVNAISVPSDGIGVIVGGDFQSVKRIGGTAHLTDHLARFFDDGEVDATFDATINAPVHTIQASHQGYLYIGGAFNAVDGVTQTGLIRLHSADASFDPSLYMSTSMSAGTPSWVNSVALQGDGRLLIGGRFDRFGVLFFHTDRSKIGRVMNTLRVPVESISFATTNAVQWVRDKSSTGLRGAPELLLSTTCCSSSAFSALPGTMTWSPLQGGSWRYNGLPTQVGTYYLRARARIGDGHGSGYYESPIYRFAGLGDQIFANGFDQP